MAIKQSKYNNDKVKQEVNKLIDTHGLYNYEIKRIVSVHSVTTLEIKLELRYMEDGEKIIV